MLVLTEMSAYEHNVSDAKAEESSVVLGAEALETNLQAGAAVAGERSVVSGASAPETNQPIGGAGVVSQDGAAGENTHGEESPNCIKGVWNVTGHTFYTLKTVSSININGEEMEQYPSGDVGDYNCWVRGRNRLVQEQVLVEKSCPDGMECTGKFCLEKQTGRVAVYPALTVTCFLNHMCSFKPTVENDKIRVLDDASHCCVQDLAARVKTFRCSYNRLLKHEQPTDRCGNRECPWIHCDGWADHIRSLAVLEAERAQAERARVVQAEVVAHGLASIPEEQDIEEQDIEEVTHGLATLSVTTERQQWLLEQDAEADRRKAARDKREAQNQLKAKVADAQAAKVARAATHKANIAATKAAAVKQREQCAEIAARNARELLETAAADAEQERLAREEQIRLCQADRDARLARIQQAQVAQVAREQQVQAALAERAQAMQAQAMRAQEMQAQEMRAQEMRAQAVQAQAQVEQVQVQAEFVVPGPRVNEVFYRLPTGQIVYYTLLADGKPVLVLV